MIKKQISNNNILNANTNAFVNIRSVFTLLTARQIQQQFLINPLTTKNNNFVQVGVHIHSKLHGKYF